MNTPNEPKRGERIEARWVMVKQENSSGAEQDASTDSHAPPRFDMEFVENGQVRGYIDFKVENINKNKTLVLGLLRVEGHQQPVILLSLFKELYAYAKKENITHVSWTPGSPIVERFTKKHFGTPYRTQEHIEVLRQKLFPDKV